MSARSTPARRSGSAAAMRAFREWKTPVTSRVRTWSRISSDDACIEVFQAAVSRRIVELGQFLQFVLCRAGQRNLLSIVVDDKAVIRHRHKVTPHTEEAAHLQDREIQLLRDLVCDHIDRKSTRLNS